jgi:hypothetical protein
MPLETDELGFSVTGSIFTINGARVFDTENPVPGTVTLNATNSSDHWIDIIVQNEVPKAGAIVWQSGHMDPGESRSSSVQLQFHSGARFKIFRWAPGPFFGAPGTGGGDATFVLPTTGDVTVNFTISD